MVRVALPNRTLATEGNAASQLAGEGQVRAIQQLSAPQPLAQEPCDELSRIAAVNTTAILALVLAFFFAPLGIVFGAIAKRQTRATGDGGNGLAQAGDILGIVFTALAVLAVLAASVAVIGSAGVEVDAP